MQNQNGEINTMKPPAETRKGGKESNEKRIDKSISAFDVLMSKSSVTKKQKLSLKGNSGKISAESQSRFVMCPICQKGVPIATVEFHTEQCLSTATADATNRAKTATKATEPATAASSTYVDNDKILKTKAKPNADTSKDAFQHLMDQSKLLSRPPLKQRFHLHSDLTVTWEDVVDGEAHFKHGNVAVVSQSEQQCHVQQLPIVQWSASTMLEASSSSTSREVERSIELIISSSIPSATTEIKLISNLSKLSIPILKSMIQKSIRRRLPLQALKVAMELSVKSWGDLIRRLPIIMLEDAALHPDLPLLVWLMVADTKNFSVNSIILERVMSIVYELASCGWRDDDDYDPSGKNAYESCTLNNDAWLRGLRIQNRTIIKAMLLRARYGGMMCDVVMMQNYAKLWTYRFHCDHDGNSLCPLSPSVIKSAYDQIASIKLADCNVQHQQEPTEAYDISWTGFPSKLYDAPRKEYEQLGKPIVTQAQIPGQVNYLQLKDLCLEGLDFHCCYVLDFLLEHQKDAILLLIRATDNNKNTSSDNNNNNELVRSLCQKSMWKYSSGVNRKQFLFRNVCTQESSALSTSLWNFMEPHVHQFARKFVLQRIVSPLG